MQRVRLYDANGNPLLLRLREDDAHVSGDPGIMALVVRKDTAAALAGTDGDYAPLEVDASGRIHISTAPANSGVDIGDVDVTSVVPGTGATNLGKAVDAVAGATDSGVAPVAVRDDALGALTPVEGDYVPLRTDANGALWTHDDALDAAIAGSELQVDVVAALPAGTNAIGKLAANSGVDIGDVDVTSIIPGTGATNLGKAVDAVAGATDSGVAPLAVRDDALGALTPVEGDYVPLRTDANGALWTHDDALDAALAGSELQVDVVAALPAGTNAIGKLAANSGVDIGDVDILSIAAGDNNIGNVDIVTEPVSLVDDAAFTVATSRVMPMGALADETGTDPVDEGDIGAPRMTLTRVLRVVPSLHDGTTEGADSMRGNVEETLLASAARTATTATAAQTNRNARGVFISLNVTTAPNNGETLTVKLRERQSGLTANLFQSAALFATGTTGYYFAFVYPGAGAAADDVNATRGYPLPRNWDISIAHSASSSWTYVLKTCTLL